MKKRSLWLRQILDRVLRSIARGETTERTMRSSMATHEAALRSVGPSHEAAIKTVAYNESTILSVTRDSLEYLDDQGLACAIEFHICDDNVQREVRSEGWIQVRESQDVYLGFRDFSSRPRHITLASVPRTRFQFEDYGVFREFQERLIEAGVTTLDMA